MDTKSIIIAIQAIGLLVVIVAAFGFWGVKDEIIAIQERDFSARQMEREEELKYIKADAEKQLAQKDKELKDARENAAKQLAQKDKELKDARENAAKQLAQMKEQLNSAIEESKNKQGDTWRGLVVAPEHRCSPYEGRRDYSYPRSIEHEIANQLGTVYGPYTMTCFASILLTDVNHIVGTREAHDSGLCAQDSATRAKFAQDLRNLTLISSGRNRRSRSEEDAAEWLPPQNRCWFAGKVLEVKGAYGLTVDQREADALERVLRGCKSTAMKLITCP